MRLLPLLLLCACVSKGTYEVAQVQLRATREALNARDAAARRAEEEAREREDALKTRLAELESRVALQRTHQTELEQEIHALSHRLAEHALHDRVACPPCTSDATSEEEPTTEQLARRAHVDATLEEVAEALAHRARERLEASEREVRHQHVQTSFADLVDRDLVSIERHPRGTMVRILVAKLYNENSTTLSPLGTTLVRELARSCEDLRDHRLEIVGHTDDLPFSSITLPSSWELGFAYAAGLVRTLEEFGCPLHMTAGSAAATEPLVEPVDAEARRLNRRVELLFVPRLVELPPARRAHPPHPAHPPDTEEGGASPNTERPAEGPSGAAQPR